jgi:hypothetical protein
VQATFDLMTTAVSGTPVTVADFKPTAPPKSDIEVLVDNIGRLRERELHVRTAQRTASMLKAKMDIATLGFEALDFKGELNSWVAFAERLLDEQFGEQFDNADRDRAELALERGLRRALADSVKTLAKQHVAPLQEAVTWLRDTRDFMGMIVSWCQNIQRTTASDEYSEAFAAGNAVPDQMFTAPVGDALTKSVRRATTD